jgi:small redox-active disulfide protein 2
MRIQILGTGCPNCKRLETNTLDALKTAGIQAELEKITEIDKIMEFGVLSTPALAVDGKVMSAGRVLNKAQIIEILGRLP